MAFDEVAFAVGNKRQCLPLFKCAKGFAFQGERGGKRVLPLPKRCKIIAKPEFGDPQG